MLNTARQNKESSHVWHLATVTGPALGGDMAAEIDVGSTIFAYGQASVALSRVRSLEGLRLIAFDKKKVKANPTVLEFYHKMSPGN